MVSATSTMVVINKDNNTILLGKRIPTADAYPDVWSVPGGFLDAKTNTNPGETLEQAAARELKEEINLDIKNTNRFILIGVGSDPNIDPRCHCIGARYIIEITNQEADSCVAGDDLQELKWVSIFDREEFLNLAFDHTSIVFDAISYYAKNRPGKYYRFGDDSIGLAVMRTQPLHYGHCLIIDQMIKDNDEVIIAIGSCNQEVSDKNPFSFEERKTMLRKVYGSRIKIVGVDDIGDEENENSWCDHVLDTIQKYNLPAPTDYYSGSDFDAKWYRGRFDKIHIVNRDENNFISATEIREMIKANNQEWKNYIPRINQRLIMEKFS